MCTPPSVKRRLDTLRCLHNVVFFHVKRLALDLHYWALSTDLKTVSCHLFPWVTPRKEVKNDRSWQVHIGVVGVARVRSSHVLILTCFLFGVVVVVFAFVFRFFFFLKVKFEVLHCVNVIRYPTSFWRVVGGGCNCSEQTVHQNTAEVLSGTQKNIRSDCKSQFGFIQDYFSNQCYLFRSSCINFYNVIKCVRDSLPSD